MLADVDPCGIAEEAEHDDEDRILSQHLLVCGVNDAWMVRDGRQGKKKDRRCRLPVSVGKKERGARVWKTRRGARWNCVGLDDCALSTADRR
jgi:hypothetical protein